MTQSHLRVRSFSYGIPVLVLLVAGLMGCQGGPNRIMSQANPNPLSGATSFEIQPVTWHDLTVDGDPEAEWKAEKRADSVASFEEDKQAINSFLLAEATDRAGRKNVTIAEPPFGSDAPFVIVPTISEVETGYYRIPAWRAVTRIRVNVKITRRSGEVVDEVEFVDGVTFDALAWPSSGQRFRMVAAEIGKRLGDYVVKRSKAG